MNSLSWLSGNVSQPTWLGQWENQVPGWLEVVDQRILGSGHGRHFLLALLAIVLCFCLTGYSHDSREPKLIKPFIPFLGHAIGIYKYGSRHFTWIA